MSTNLKLLALTTLIITFGASSAYAHSIEGVEAGLLHLVSNMDHILVLLVTILFGSIAIVKGLKIRHALRDRRD